jgi:outer membrane protein assembly factor BamB
MVFAASGDAGNALQAIALGRSGDLTGSDAVKWHVDRGTPFVPSPLLYGDQLYFLARNNAILSCHQAETGTATFAQARLEGLAGIYASPVGAADRLYVVDRKGKTVVIKRSTNLEILATNTLDEGFDASPAIVGNDLLLRGKEYLYCISGN